jgi:hypothetical protein
MRPCARHEIILLSVEVIQAARPGVWRGGEAQSREIIEKLDRIGQLLVNGAWLPVSKMHIKEKRYATNKDHFSGSGYHFMANAHDLPHRTSSRELRTAVTELAAVILVGCYGELVREESGDTARPPRGVIVFTCVSKLLVAIISAIGLLVALAAFKKLGFAPEGGLTRSFIFPAILLVTAWTVIHFLLLIDPSMDTRLRKSIRFFARLWNDFKIGDENKEEKKRAATMRSENDIILAASAMWYARKSGRPFRSSHVDDVSRTLNGNLVTVGW